MLVVMVAVHALVSCPRNHMPEVTDNGIDEKELTMFIPIMTPRVGGAMADHLEVLSGGVIAPDATLDIGPFGGRRSGNTNF